MPAPAPINAALATPGPIDAEANIRVELHAAFSTRANGLCSWAIRKERNEIRLVTQADGAQALVN